MEEFAKMMKSTCLIKKGTITRNIYVLFTENEYKWIGDFGIHCLKKGYIWDEGNQDM